MTISLKAIYAGSETIWWWNTRIYHNGDAQHLKAEFRQSTFFAKPLGLQNLHKRQSSSTPELGDTGRIDLFILQQMDGRKTLKDIARRAQKQFPDHFNNVTDALRRVSDLSEKYSRDSKDRS